jgi:DNA polymerase I-like protein with 3'-5' exonuclease and polymerase domains
MRVLTHRVAGSEVRINIVESDADLEPFIQFIKDNPVCAFDTETTGGFLIYSNTYKIRLAQFGNGSESYVIPVERSARWAYVASCALQQIRTVIIQNASFDVQVVERHWGIKVNWAWIVDTKIISHLVDSRPKKDGGAGHKLEEITAAHIDKQVAEEVKGSMAVMCKEMRTTKDKIWAIVDINNETYLRYAGMDPILAFRAWEILLPRVPASARNLIEYEHTLARIACQIEARGILVDEKYTRRQVTRFKSAETRAAKKARDYYVDNVNAPQQVIDGLRYFGIKDFGITDKGNESVDSKMLKSIASGSGHASELAKAVIDGKRASKWNTTYFQRFLETMDSTGRIHPGIHTLAARTARMSITNPAVQTLPGKSDVIRNCLLASEGNVWVAIDYDGQELRMAAALSKDPVMIDAFKRRLDLHQITADAAAVDRSIGKMTNFLTVYGGGSSALMTQGGLDESTAKKTIEGFKAAYPGLTAYTKKVVKSAQQRGYVTTPTGRRLPVDRSRAYAGGNYEIQSGSRDVTGFALVKLDKAGFTPHILLPVHDEIDFDFPKEDAEEMSREAAKHMQMSMGEVDFTVDIQIGEQAWGSLPDFDKTFAFDNEEGEEE